jgi:hypothetical protein
MCAIVASVIVATTVAGADGSESARGAERPSAVEVETALREGITVNEPLSPGIDPTAPTSLTSDNCRDRAREVSGEAWLSADSHLGTVCTIRWIGEQGLRIEIGLAGRGTYVAEHSRCTAGMMSYAIKLGDGEVTAFGTGPSSGGSAAPLAASEGHRLAETDLGGGISSYVTSAEDDDGSPDIAFIERLGESLRVADIPDSVLQCREEAR